MMQSKQHRSQSGFSLIELVIVVVIIGIIGAIAIPRMSRGASGAADSALTANLSVLRNAIDLYAAEHGGDFPTLANLNTPGGDDAPNALLDFTDSTGGTSVTRTSTHIYGPYLRSIPPLPVGSNRGETSFTSGELGTAGAGWHYDAATGTIRANLDNAEVDDSNTPYNSY